MTTIKLSQIQSSIVGDAPEMFLLKTPDNQATVESAGYMNNVQRAHNLSVTPDSFVFASLEDGTVSVVYETEFNGNIITLKDIAGGSTPPGVFDYLNVFWVAKGGNDASSGTNPSEPKLTIQGAIDAFATPTTPSTIIIFDNQTYNETPVIPAGSTIKIVAPTASILTAGGGTIVVTANSDLFIGCWSLLNGSAGNVVNCVAGGSFARLDTKILGNPGGASALATGNGGNMFVETETLTGNIVANNLITAHISRVWTGDLLRTTPSGIDTLHISFGTHAGDINVTDATLVYKGNEWSGTTFAFGEGAPGNSNLAVDVEVTPDDYALRSIGILNPVTGRFGAKFYGTLFTRIVNSTVTTPVDIDASTWKSWDGTLVVHDNASQRIFAFRNDTDVPQGFSMAAIQAGAGRIQFNMADSATLPISETAGNIIYTDITGSQMSMQKLNEAAQPEYGVWGNLWAMFSASATHPNVFVSQEAGDDALGNGSEESPFASISAAITAIGAPASPTFIRVVDGATYSETCTFPSPNVFLLAPGAVITQSGVADTIVIGTPAPDSFFMNVGVLLNTGTGKLISHTSDSGYLINATAMIGAIDMGDASGTLRSFSNIISDVTVNNGTLNYSAITRTGTNTVTGTGAVRGSDIDKIISTNFPGGATIMASSLANVDPGANTIAVDATAGFAALAAAGTVPFITASVGSSYRLRDLFLNSGGTNFDAGGDRDLHITDGTTTFSIIPAATLKALANDRWGSVAVPYPVASAINAITLAGIDVTLQYSGGAGVDYVAGSVVISGVYERIS